VTAKVVPLRTAAVDDGQAPLVVPRLVAPGPEMNDEQLRAARQEQIRLIAQNEVSLSARVARTIHEKWAPVEDWVGAVLTSGAEEGDEGDAAEANGEPFVGIAPRENALELVEPWKQMQDALRKPYLPDRLDCVVEAHLSVMLLTLDVDPALPVTRRQAEAANLPLELLFAKGQAFTSVRDEPVDDAVLLDAAREHRRLVDEQADSLLESALEAVRKHAFDACAGVVLSLGEKGEAVTVVPKEKARKIVADHPFLARRLDRPPRRRSLPDGREALALPILVWAKGHLSVTFRDFVERT
jgi:hypothetical protein